MELYVRILELFGLTWLVGYLFSIIEYSNCFINKPILSRLLFIIKSKPVPLTSAIWQLLNYFAFTLVIINTQFKFIDNEKALKYYSGLFFNGLFIFIIIIIFDGLISFYKKK